MPDRAHVKTDKEIERIQRYLLRFYVEAKKKSSKAASSFLDGIFAEAKELKEKAEKAESQEEKKKAEAKYRAYFVKVVTSAKYKDLSKTISKIMFEANKKSAKYINSKTAGVYAYNYNEMGKDLQRDLKGYELHEATEKDASAYADLERQEVNEKKDRKWNEGNLTKGIIAGAILGLAADKIFDRATSKVVQRNIESSRRQASDIMTGAESKGRMDAMYRVEDEGFSVQKVWVCIFDNRTRDSHIDYDSLGPVDLDYEYNTGLKRPKDSDCGIMEEVCNCRCAIRYNTNGKGRSETRTARSGEVTGSYKDPSSFVDTETYSISQMTYREWIQWRSR